MMQTTKNREFPASLRSPKKLLPLQIIPGHPLPRRAQHLLDQVGIDCHQDVLSLPCGSEHRLHNLFYTL